MWQYDALKSFSGETKNEFDAYKFCTASTVLHSSNAEQLTPL